MKRLALLVLVACSSQSRPDGATANGPWTPSADDPVRTAPHGGAIDLLAVSDDGKAAVTQDGMGGSRLWPTLDGTREPVIITLARAVELAIGRDGEGFVIAARDEVGGLELVRFADTGRELSHVRLAPDPAVQQIAIIAQGVLALRDDQTLAILSPSGQLRARLAADPGMRMKHVVARRDRALVLYEQAGAMRGRWLAYLDWGFDTPALDFKPHLAVQLSTSGKSLMLDHMDGTARVVEIATGDAVVDYGELSPVGFLDDTTQVLRAGTLIKWGTGRRDTMKDGPVTNELGVAYAVGDGFVVTAHRQTLVLHSPERVQYLGYGASDVKLLRVVGDRMIVGDGDQTPRWVDHNLVVGTPLRLPDDPRVLEDIVPIDDRYAITSHTIGSPSISVLDRVRQKTQQSIQHMVMWPTIEYERSTGLLAIADSAANYVTRWDPRTATFGVWYRLAGGAPASTALFDPARTDGVAAITVLDRDGFLHVAEFHVDDLEIGKAVEPRMTYRVQGRWMDSDRDGRLYIHDRSELVVYQARETVRIIEVGSDVTAVAASGHGIAVLGGSLLRLYDAAGTLKWETAAPLASDVRWLGDMLVVNYGSGLGKIDAASGALIQRTCGWSFGLSALPNNDAREHESICDAQ